MGAQLGGMDAGAPRKVGPTCRFGPSPCFATTCIRSKICDLELVEMRPLTRCQGCGEVRAPGLPAIVGCSTCTRIAVEADRARL